MVLRPAVRPTTAVEEATRAANSPGPSSAQRQVLPVRAAPALDPVEVQRVADAVLRTIDRRILAERERTGAF